MARRCSRWIFRVRPPSISPDEVRKRLAEELGVVTRDPPFSILFSEETRRRNDVDVDALAAVDWASLEQAGEVKKDDRWIRSSVANIDDAMVRRVHERLGESENIFGWTLEDPC